MKQTLKKTVCIHIQSDHQRIFRGSVLLHPHKGPLHIAFENDGSQNFWTNSDCYLPIIPTSKNGVFYVPIMPTFELETSEKT